MTHNSKISEAGEMHSITLNGITTYIISTKEGFFRGGKRYFADKVFRVLAGEVELISEKSGFDVHETFSPSSGERIIPAQVAHIFKALSDSVFLEYFPENTKTEEYKRYREMKK